MAAIQTASSTRITSDGFRCRISQFIVVVRYDQPDSEIAHPLPYFSRQPTSTLLVKPLDTTTGPLARQTPVPPSYCGLCPETVWVPTATDSGGVRLMPIDDGPRGFFASPGRCWRMVRDPRAGAGGQVLHCPERVTWNVQDRRWTQYTVDSCPEPLDGLVDTRPR